MASFDPSIISQIPDFAGNPMEARAKAFKLADLMTQEQSNKLLLGKQKEDMAEQQRTRDIFQKGDPTTVEGRMKLAGEFSKAGLAKPAMDVLKFSGEQQERDMQAQEGKLKLLQYASDVIGPEAYQIKQVLQTQGLPMAQAMYQKRLAEILPQLPPGAQHKFPPQLPNDPQQAAQLLDGAINSSQQARQMLTQQRQQAAETEKERHDRAMEAHGMQMEGLAAQRQSAGALDEGDLRSMAQQYLAGDKSVFQNLGRGTQGSKNIAALRHMIRTEGEKAGLSPQDVATKIAEFGGLMAEERAVGTRQAAIEVAATEASKMVPIAIKASEAVPRGKFVPINQLIQKGEIMTSDPALMRFAQANLTLANIYARAVNPTGVPTDSARDHALAILNTAQSQESYAGVVDIIKMEIEAARSSPPQVRSDIRASVKGQYQAPAPGPVAGAAPAGGGGKTVNWADLK